MSDSLIGGLLIILLAVAYGIYRYIKKRNDKAKAEPLRALLRLRIEEYTREGNLNAAKDRYFSSAVEDDTAHGRPPEEIDINRRRVVEAERAGRSLLLAAKTLEAVIEQPTKAEMIALMKRYVLEFGHDHAEQARLYNRTAGDREKEQIETKGLQSAFVVRVLNEILAESKDDLPAGRVLPPLRARDAKTFDKGAKLNRWADELRRVAAKELTGSDIAVALQTALGNEVAARVLRRNPSFSPDQKQYAIDEVLNAVCPGVREAAYIAANLPEPNQFDDGRDLTSEEFHQLTLRIINAATKSNAPVSDAISATAKAMGAMICILAERPGTSAEDLIKSSQKAVAEFTQHAIAERAAQRSPGPTT
jgi:hypothetical protein